MKFGAFQRSQGEVQQNIKPRSPQSTSDQVDPIGQSPCQEGPTGRPVGPLCGWLAPLCSQLGQVLHVNISPYVGKKESEAMSLVRPQDPVSRPHVLADRPLCSTASSSTFVTRPTLGPYK
jgi:hypothetical protein